MQNRHRKHFFGSNFNGQIENLLICKSDSDGGLDSIPDMLFEDGVTMEFEDSVDMEYE